jgi:hypothetical protein
VEAKPIKYEQLYPFECKLLVDTFGPKIYELNFETSYKAFFKINNVSTIRIQSSKINQNNKNILL